MRVATNKLAGLPGCDQLCVFGRALQVLQEAKGHSSRTCGCHRKWRHQTSQKLPLQAVLNPFRRLSGCGRGDCATLGLERNGCPACSAFHFSTSVKTRKQGVRHTILENRLAAISVLALQM